MQKTLIKITDTAKLAELFGITTSNIHTTLRQYPSLYRKIEIPKRGSGNRVIKIPTDTLKCIQRAILDKILTDVPMSPYAYGFGKGKSIVDNARLHSKSQYLFNSDIQDFFPSVHFRRIEKIFRSLGANDEVTAALTKLTTLDYCLPQGAPTSPYLASLALKNLDQRLAGLCSSNRLIYSRYFDDITISGSDRAHSIVEKVAKIIETEGYHIHHKPDKLRLPGPADEKLVTGILIKNGDLCPLNEKEILDYIRELQLHGIKALKSDSILKEQLSLKGKINFVGQVNRTVADHLTTELDKIIW